jgi:hypothetical protein
MLSNVLTFSEPVEEWTDFKGEDGKKHDLIFDVYNYLKHAEAKSLTKPAVNAVAVFQVSFVI